MSATSTVSSESVTSAIGGDTGYQGMLAQLRDDLLSTLLAPTAICALYASLLITWTSKEAPFAHIWAGLAALAICLGAHRLVRTHPRRAALLYTAGLTALTIQGAARPGLGWLNVVVFIFFCCADECVMPRGATAGGP